MAKGPKDLYAYADADTTLALLMHKIVRASHEEGLLEARSLLQDWLVILRAHYNMQVQAGKPSAQVTAPFVPLSILSTRLSFASLGNRLCSSRSNSNPAALAGDSL